MGRYGNRIPCGIEETGDSQTPGFIRWRLDKLYAAAFQADIEFIDIGYNEIDHHTFARGAPLLHLLRGSADAKGLMFFAHPIPDEPFIKYFTQVASQPWF